MAVKEKFVLRWNEYSLQMCSSLQDLRQASELFDITLAVENKQILAHKLVLSASSPFFRNVIKNNPHHHPLVYLKGVKYSSLASILNFMYHGEVSVAQDELTSFLNVAEDLKVKGLTQGQEPERNGTNNTNNHVDNPNESHSNKPKSAPIAKSVPIERPLPSSSNSDEIKVSKVINSNKRTKPVEPAISPEKRLKPSRPEEDIVEIDAPSPPQKRSKKSTSEKSIERSKTKRPTSKVGMQVERKPHIERKSTSEVEIEIERELINEKAKTVIAALTDGLSKNEKIDNGPEITAAPGLIRRSGRKIKKTLKATEKQPSLDGSSKDEDEEDEVEEGDDEEEEEVEVGEDDMEDVEDYGTLKTEITFAETEVEVGNVPEIPVLADQGFDDQNLFGARSESSSSNRDSENTKAVIATLNEALDDLTKDYVTQMASKDWKCLSCSKLFYSKMQSQLHVENDHLTSQGHVCPTCFTQFPTIKAVKDHVSAGCKRMKEEDVVIDDRYDDDEVQCVQEEIPLIDL